MDGNLSKLREREKRFHRTVNETNENRSQIVFSSSHFVTIRLFSAICFNEKQQGSWSIWNSHGTVRYFTAEMTTATRTSWSSSEHRSNPFWCEPVRILPAYLYWRLHWRRHQPGWFWQMIFGSERLNCHFLMICRDWTIDFDQFKELTNWSVRPFMRFVSNWPGVLSYEPSHCRHSRFNINFSHVHNASNNLVENTRDREEKGKEEENA